MIVVEWAMLRDGATFDRRTDGSVGFDLTACIDLPLVIHPGCIERVPLGVAVDLSNAGGALLLARSSLSKRGLALANGVGLIDCDYRGELLAAVVNIGNSVAVVNPLHRIAQLVVLPRGCASVTAACVGSLDETSRGAGGFGSTGAS